MIDALVDRADRDQAFAATLTASVRRVLVLKQRHGLVSCG
jgi:beta-N-acetylhexosaminidase